VPVDFALDPATGDLALTKGRPSLVRGAACTAQLWAAHVTMFRGEWAFDRNRGIDYQHQVLEKGMRLSVLRSLFARASREVPGVEAVESVRVSLDPRTRELTVDAQVLHADGSSGVLSTSATVGA
jgi:hypothetical protein